jgi:hypothetical protein
VHIARKELGIPEEDYRDMLRQEFGPSTAADLSIGELERLVERFRSKGWHGQARLVRGTGDQAAALKERIGQELLNTDFDEIRLRGLVRKICGVEDLRWVRDPVPLRRLLAVIGSMMDQGKINPQITQINADL